MFIPPAEFLCQGAPPVPEARGGATHFMLVYVLICHPFVSRHELKWTGENSVYYLLSPDVKSGDHLSQSESSSGATNVCTKLLREIALDLFVLDLQTDGPLLVWLKTKIRF